MKTNFNGSIFIPIGCNSCLAFELGSKQNKSFKKFVCPKITNSKPINYIQHSSTQFPNLSDSYGLPQLEHQAVWETFEQGSSEIFSAVAELRIRLIGHLAGVVFQSFKFCKELGLKQATGIGARYMTPFGMLCIDLSAKWKNEQNFTDTCSWRVALGQAF